MEIAHRTYHNCSDKFVYAMREGDLTTVEKILYESPSWAENAESSELQLLYLAVLRGHTDIVKLLIKLGADVNFMNGNLGSLFHVALNEVRDNTKELCEILIDAGADVNKLDRYGLAPLQVAIDKQLEDVAEILIEHGADIKLETSCGWSLLHFAARSGARRICELLVRAGIDLNQRDTDGYTPTHVAIEERCIDVARTLLEHGVNVHLKINNGRTLLHLAANIGSEMLCQLLVEGGADVNARDKAGLTPLHIAARKQHMGAMEFLLNAGADISASDDDGGTPLHGASEFEKHRAVLSLIEHGADVNILNNDGKTAFHIVWSRDSIVYEQNLLKMHVATNENVGDLEGHGIKTDVIEENGFMPLFKGEVEKMKRTKINNTNVTFHDILTKSLDQLVFYLRNADIVQALRLNDYQREFPEYGCLIEGRLRRSRARKELLDEGHRFFLGRFSKTRDLPYKCADQILNYLSNRDLTNMKKSFSFSQDNDVTEPETMPITNPGSRGTIIYQSYL